MTDRDPTPAETERLLRVMDRLLEARDADETIDVDAWANQHGVTRDDIGGLQAAMDAIHAAVGEDLPANDPLPPPTLPDDFELLGELGRGGMGDGGPPRLDQVRNVEVCPVELSGRLVVRGSPGGACGPAVLGLAHQAELASGRARGQMR